MTIQFKAIAATKAAVILDGKRTPYTVSKGGNLYSIYWKSNPLPSFYTSENRAEIIEHLEEIASLPCVPRPYSNLYYVPTV